MKPVDVFVRSRTASRHANMDSLLYHLAATRGCLHEHPLLGLVLAALSVGSILEVAMSAKH
jgi:hypothetical protein